jgi:hypothetical protein
VLIALGFALTTGAISRWTEQNGDVIVEDSHLGVRLTFVADDGKLATDEENGEYFVWPFDHNLSIKGEVLNPVNMQIDWIYLYWGDGEGTFLNSNGENRDHAYGDKSRYNPTVVAKVDGTVLGLTQTVYEFFPANEPPSYPLPNYTPPTTFNRELNEVLANLSLDNSGAEPQGVVYCICGKRTNNCGRTNAKIAECRLSLTACDSNC